MRYQGVFHDFLDVYDFLPDDPQNPDAGWRRVLSFVDDSASACFAMDDGLIRSNHIDAYRLEPAKPLRLVVDVRLAEQRPTPAFRTLCEENAKAAEQTLDLEQAMKFEPRRLLFAWDGRTFVPDPDTSAFLTARHLTVRDSEQ